ncbi:MAG: hypothetical protein Q3972_03115 [Corynebacterium sp.]|nr:hypothetical protein [Corynebacterium sp.]
MKNMTRGDLAVLLALLSLVFFAVLSIIAGKSFFSMAGALALVIVLACATQYRNKNKQ